MTKLQERIKGRLGDLLPLKYGKSLPAALRDSAGSVPVYGSSGVVGSHSVALTNGPVIIVGRKGNVGAVHYSAVPCWPIDTAYFAEPPIGHDPRYYRYLLDSLGLVRLDKSTAIPGLSRDDYNAVEVVIHPPEQQAEIVAEIEKQFSRLDEAVANLQRVKANLKRYKASVLKAAVEGCLVETEASIAQREGRSYETGEQLLQRVLLARPDQWSARGRYVEPLEPDTKGLSLLPEGWTWASIDQLSDFITKGTTPAATKLFDGSGEVQFLKVYNLTFDGSLNHTHKPAYVSRATHKDELARSQVNPGDVLINIVGPPLGQVSVVPPHIEEANINQAIARIRPIKPLGADFIAISLMCDEIMRWAIRRGKTTAGQANLTLELCRALPIPVPPVAEQARIVADVDRHLSIIREVEADVETNLQRAHALRQSTLSKAFSINT